MIICICDDEQAYLQLVTERVQQWAHDSGHDSGIKITTFRSSEDLLEAWQNGMAVDVLFMDIEVPGEMSGMEVAKRIFSANEHIPIVFITNYSEYACEGYRVNALRYLRKPVSQADIDECMDIVWRRWSLQQANAITIEDPKQSIHLPAESIISIEVYGHHIRIDTTDDAGEYTLRTRMKEIMDRMPQNVIVQCHRSYAVNLMYVRKFQRNIITMSNGKDVPIGRNYTDQFINQYRLYYQGEHDS